MTSGIVVRAVFLIALFIGKTAFAESEDLSGPSLVVCLPSPVVSLDPTDFRDRETQIVMEQMFDSLTQRDSDLNVVPHLAESFRPVSNTEWEFCLKRGIRFHDGEPLTAEDVRFTFDRVIREGAVSGHTSSRKSLFGPLAEIRVLDDYTLRFRTTSPWPVLPLMISLQPIVPGDYMTRKGTAGWEKAPVGTGPYRFVEKRKDGALVLKRVRDGNPGGQDQALPLSWLVIKSEPDVVKRIAMIKRGEAGLITRIPPDFISSMTLNPEFHIISQPATRSYFAELNCRKKPFDDRRVRAAMNYAMDMTTFVSTALHGKGRALPTVLLPRAFSYDPSLHPYVYGPEKAKALLKEAGFPGGYTVQIFCDSLNETFANAIAHYLLRIGIQSRVVTGDNKTVANAMETLSADMMVSSWGNSTLDPVGIVYPKFHSKGRGNYSGYRNSRVDEFLEKAENTMDRETRKKDYQAVQQIVFQDAPMIFGYAADEFHVVRSGVNGVRAGATGMLDLSQVTIGIKGRP